MAYTSTYQWIIDRLNENKKIESTSIDSQNILHIKRVDGSSLKVISSSLQIFTKETIRPIVDQENIDFILHTCKEPFITGASLEYLDKKRKVLGGFGDLFRVLNQDYNYPYLPPEVKFIKRGLEQHKKVSEIHRLDDRRYEISRYGLETVIIVALNDYDISIESVRNAIDKYENFHAILKSNPNGNITSSALKLSESLEIKVLKWGELLGKLNNKWR